MIDIRTFLDQDRTELMELFSRAGEGSPTGSLWGDPESEAAIYLVPYMELEPQHLFLAEDGGALVGYLAGCRDTAAFPTESQRIENALREHRLFLRRRAAGFFARSMVDVLMAKLRYQPMTEDFTDPRWPSHLHMNLAPEARGTGAADALMRSYLDRLRDTGSPGCHLQTLVENERAVRFFSRMGFVAEGPTPAVPGLRYRGRRVHQQTMVRTF